MECYRLPTIWYEYIINNKHNLVTGQYCSSACMYSFEISVSVSHIVITDDFIIHVSIFQTHQNRELG